jgi:hypothetical protein
VSLATLLRFQFGDRSAIETAANNRGTLITGVVLVLLTAIARNYDQSFILESPLWLLGPILFSLVSGSFLFVILYYGFIRRHLEGPQEFPTSGQWRTFMGLFWMNAPIAWLYAIPVERFLPSYEAAKANLFLLALVSLGRVLLMGRIVSVVQGMDFRRAVGWVLIPAAIEVLLVVFVGGIFSPQFSRHIMAAMGGLRNAPEDVLIITAMMRATTGAVVVLGLTGLWLNLTKFDQTLCPFPSPAKGGVPIFGLLILAAAWIAIAIPAQREQKRFLEHAALVDSGKYREALDYLAKCQPENFPASRRLHPDPYDYDVFEALPRTISELTPADPFWIRQRYLDHLRIMFTHDSALVARPGYSPMFEALARLPEGTNWLRAQVVDLQNLQSGVERELAANPGERSNAILLSNVLNHLGIPPKSTTATNAK